MIFAESSNIIVLQNEKKIEEFIWNKKCVARCSQMESLTLQCKMVQITIFCCGINNIVETANYELLQLGPVSEIKYIFRKYQFISGLTIVKI